MATTFLFIILPYISLFSFLLVSIYRYRNQGFKVTSLSSQILESRILFFGSRPFHWGIVLLFFGHLTGFLFPHGVLAWNGKPVRLYVLEITALAFALLCLSGIAVLIYRRTSINRIRINTSKMDVLVFVILVISIVTGIYNAIFVRWGSSWFAIVLAPYLRSIFSFNPDITALTQLPVVVKIHVVSAFVLIGMLPFTRLIHMLVYPVHYLWRAYQVVIWNKRSPAE
ncbi:MAG TPA: respiratory nitrate reductase subunit gamma [Bacteroidales bacterium]|jgi:nitrate reductase gamma subunit|nr:respiratory nitrate reductase subunit gamma [Bacteroidales bacterium]